MKTAVLFCTGLLLFLSCQKDKNKASNPDLPASYPLKENNSWNYRTDIAFEGADTSFTQSYTTHVWVTGKKMLNDTLEAIEVLYTDVMDGSSYTIRQYYTQTETGLRNVAYKGSSNTVLRVNSLPFFPVLPVFADDHYRVYLDSIIFEKEPPLTLQYPMALGKEWNYRSHPWPVRKKISSLKILNIPAGLFHCYVVDMNYDINKDGTWDPSILRSQYISSKGLVMMELSLKNVTLTDVTGRTQGTGNLKTTSTLTSCSVK
jgi:hypothetical protein